MYYVVFSGRRVVAVLMWIYHEAAEAVVSCVGFGCECYQINTRTISKSNKCHELQPEVKAWERVCRFVSTRKHELDWWLESASKAHRHIGVVIRLKERNISNESLLFRMHWRWFWGHIVGSECHEMMEINRSWSQRMVQKRKCWLWLWVLSY